MIMDALMFFDGSISSVGVLSGTSVNSGVTFAIGSTNSTNVIDVSQIASSASGLARDIGSLPGGNDLQIICQVGTTFTSGGSATLQVQVATAPDNGSGGIGSYTVLAQSDAIAYTSLLNHTEIFRIPLPLGIQKYIKLIYVVAGANMTAGQILSFLSMGRQYSGPLSGYPSGYSNTYI